MNYRFLRIAIVVLVVVACCMLPQPALAGTPDDSYTIERYYAQAAGQQTTTSTTLVAAVTLTFTPPSTKDFVIIVSALVNNSSTSYYTQTTLDINTVDYSASYNRPIDIANNWVSFGSHKFISCTGGVAQTIKIEYCTEHADGTAYIKRANIIALEVGSNCKYIESNGESTTTETAYQPKATLTFTPPSQQDYLLLATANLKNSNDTKATLIQLTQDTNPAGGYEHESDIYSACGSASVIQNLDATEHDFVIEYATEHANYTAYVKDARITAIPIADFNSHDHAASEAESTNGTTTYADKTTMSLTTTTRGDWLIIPMALGKNDSTAAAFYSQLNIGGTTYDEFAFTPSARTTYRNWYQPTVVNLSADTHTIKIQYKTGTTAGGATAYIKHARITAIQLDTAECYSSSGHTTVDNNYDQKGDIIYAWSHGLRASQSTYAVGYYDADGTKVATDSSLSSSA